MTLKEKTNIIVDEFLKMEDDEKRYIKRNLLKEYKSLDCRVMINIMKKKFYLASKEIHLSEDAIWFLMQIFCVNGFVNGNALFGSAMRKIEKNSAEKKLELIIDQKDIMKPYTKTVLLRQLRFLVAHDFCFNLNELFCDILSWNSIKKVTQSKWISQYIN